MPSSRRRARRVRSGAACTAGSATRAPPRWRCATPAAAASGCWCSRRRSARRASARPCSLAELTGAGAERRKSEKLAACFRAARGVEIKWLVRTALPHVAVGISLEASVLPALGAAALAHAAGAAAPPPPRPRLLEAGAAVRAAYATRPDVAAVCAALLGGGGVESVRRACALRAGVPARPMLAKPATSAADLVTRLRAASRRHPTLTARRRRRRRRRQWWWLRSTSTMASEPGAPSDDGTVKIFSRKNDEMTAKFPTSSPPPSRARARREPSSSTPRSAPLAAAAARRMAR